MSLSKKTSNNTTHLLIPLIHTGKIDTMFGTDRQQLRQMYKLSWEKFQQQQPLSPLESQIAAVIQAHPEYHDFVTQLEKDFLPELGQTNPFLHMGLHLGLTEQLSTNRPTGITQIYHKLIKRKGNEHDAQHSMIECLAQAMWSAQHNNTAPDDSRYLASLKELLKT